MIPATQRKAAAAIGAWTRNAPATATAPSPQGAVAKPQHRARRCAEHRWKLGGVNGGRELRRGTGQDGWWKRVANSPSRSGGRRQPGRRSWWSKRATANPAANRAAATIGPKRSHVAAAAGSERAEGPVVQPQPRYAMALEWRKRRPAMMPASKNGAASKRALADVASAQRRVSGVESVARASSAPA